MAVLQKLYALCLYIILYLETDSVEGLVRGAADGLGVVPAARRAHGQQELVGQAVHGPRVVSEGVEGRVSTVVVAHTAAVLQTVRQ